MTDKELLKKTIVMLQEHRLSATPNNYAVVFGYLSAINPGLVEAVDARIRSRPDHRLSSTDCDELHERFLEEKERVDIDGHYSALIRLLGQAGADIDKGSRYTAGYRQALAKGATALSDTQNQTQTLEIISQLVKETEAMQAYTRELQTRLDEMNKEVGSLREEMQQIRAESELDPLTGLANRRSFSKRLTALCEEAAKEHRPLCIIMADIDFFKRFNDTYGHAVGDNVLCHVSRKLKDMVRENDFIARYGGEEFIMLLPDTRLDDAIVLAERCRRAISASVLRQANTQKVLGHINMSYGVSTYRLGESTYDLIARADAALYTAKAEGRNCVRVEKDLVENGSSEVPSDRLQHQNIDIH